MDPPIPAAPADLLLAAIFRARSPEAACGVTMGETPIPPAQPDSALGASLRRLFEEGKRAFPGLDLTAEAFVHHLAARAAAGALPPPVRAPDLYLACACEAQVRGALEAFERAHLDPVGTYLARMQPSAVLVDDVQQSLREKLFVGKGGGPPKIAEYDGRGALASWVRVVALRTAIDLRRSRADAIEEPPGERRDPATADPETDYLKQRYREAFNTAVQAALAVLGSAQRELLRAHFVDGMTLDQLAARAGVHRATIARRIAAAREAVAAEARLRLQAALGASDSELASLAGIMRSQIDVSVHRLLQPTPS